MSPQLQTVLKHLQQHGSISQAEANTVYKIRSLPTRIFELKRLGHTITSTLKKDPTGQKYARYSLHKPPKVGDRVRVLKDLSIAGEVQYLKGDLGTFLENNWVQFDKVDGEYRDMDGIWHVMTDLMEVI